MRLMCSGTDTPGSARCASGALFVAAPRSGSWRHQPAPHRRVKDIADFEGVRSNMLVGYGLVVGLNGTGDTLRNSMFTQESLMAMLERLG